MRADLLIAGVGGQGVLAVASVLAEGARRSGLAVKQGEVHGMAQRGGAVHATLRISTDPIASELVARGSATMILGMEPVEALRYLEYLSPGGVLLTTTEPMRNIPDYPPLEEVHGSVRSVGGHLVDATTMARDAGSIRAANVVMVGAASRFLDISPARLEEAIATGFAAKGDRVVAINLAAFRSGRAALDPAAADR